MIFVNIFQSWIWLIFYIKKFKKKKKESWIWHSMTFITMLHYWFFWGGFVAT